MREKAIVSVLVAAAILLMPFIGPAAAGPNENNPNIVAFDGDWCRVKVIDKGDLIGPGERKNQEALWAVTVGNELVDGYYYAVVDFKIKGTRRNDTNDPLYCYGNGMKGLVEGNFTLIPLVYMPDGEPPDKSPEVEGSWKGTWQGTYYVDDNGYTWWRLQGAGQGTGILAGLKIYFNGENMRISTMNCENNIRKGCEGKVDWIPWEFKGYILDPTGKYFK